MANNGAINITIEPAQTPVNEQHPDTVAAFTAMFRTLLEREIISKKDLRTIFRELKDDMKEPAKAKQRPAYESNYRDTYGM